MAFSTSFRNFTTLSPLVVTARADPPEVADGRHVLSPWHDPLVAVGEQGERVDAAGGKGLFHDGVGNGFLGARRHGGLDHHKAIRRHPLADGPHGRFKRRHLDFAGAHVAQTLLGVVVLHVDHHAIGQSKAVTVEGNNQGLLFVYAAANNNADLSSSAFTGETPG